MFSSLSCFSLLWRWCLFFAVPAVGLWLLLGLVPPTPQWEAYHAFADQRELWGIPNFSDVFSNSLFVLAGFWGWWAVAHSYHQRSSRILWALFFLAIVGVGVGSAFYHYTPMDATLLWDRIPIVVGTGVLFWALLVDRAGGILSWSFGTVWFLLSLAGVLWWWGSERAGAGDLRLYGFVTLYPFVGILLLWSLWPARYERQGWVIVGLVLYALSRLAELYDVSIFTLSGELTSGHTLKHVAAAAAIFCVIAALRGRPLPRQAR